jgi:predicted DNA-binding transcriptional regulator AlpA
VRSAPDFESLLRPVREAARDLPRDAVPGLCGALAALQAELVLRPGSDASGSRDRALSPKEAAQAIGRSRDWLYRHRHELPATRLSSGRWVISESRLRRWMESRSR